MQAAFECQLLLMLDILDSLMQAGGCQHCQVALSSMQTRCKQVGGPPPDGSFTKSGSQAVTRMRGTTSTALSRRAWFATASGYSSAMVQAPVLGCKGTLYSQDKDCSTMHVERSPLHQPKRKLWALCMGLMMIAPFLSEAPFPAGSKADRRCCNDLHGCLSSAMLHGPATPSAALARNTAGRKT